MGLAAFSLAVRLPLLDAPLDRDEGSLACFALGLLDGRLPYRDFIDIKPPLLYIAYLPMALAGLLDPVLFRLVAGLWNALSAILLWRLGARLGGEKAGLLAGILFALFTADPSASGFIISPEFLSHLPVIAGMLALYSALKKESSVMPVIAGILVGVSIGMKQQVIPLLGLILLAPAFRGGYRVMAGWLAGAALAGLAVTGIMAAGGLVHPALESAFWGARHIMAALPASGIPSALGKIFGGAIATQCALWLAAAIGLTDRKAPGQTRLFIGSWLFLSAVGIAFGRRPYPYYLQLAIPPLALAGALGLARLARKGAGTAITAARIAVAGAALFSLMRLAPLAAVSREIRARALHPDNNFYEAEMAANWIRENAPGDSPVFLAGSELEIAYLAKRKFAGRYPLPYLLSVKSPDSGKLRDEWMRGVRNDRPGVAVYCRSMKAWGDVYSDPATTGSIRKAALDYLEGPDWMLARSIPPFDIYIKRR